MSSASPANFHLLEFTIPSIIVLPSLEQRRLSGLRRVHRDSWSSRWEASSDRPNHRENGGVFSSLGLLSQFSQLLLLLPLLLAIRYLPPHKDQEPNSVSQKYEAPADPHQPNLEPPFHNLRSPQSPIDSQEADFADHTDDAVSFGHEGPHPMENNDLENAKSKGSGELERGNGGEK